MNNNIHYSPESLHDLDEIWEYVLVDLCNPDAAMNVINRIMDSIDRLQDFAEIGVPLFSVADVENDYRFLISRSYMTFYRTSGNDVYIDRILYGKRDYLKILFGDFSKEAE